MNCDKGGFSDDYLKEYRKVYSTITGFTTDKNWYYFKGILEELGLLSDQLSFSDNLSVIKEFSSLRAELPRTGVGIKAAIQFYLNVKAFVVALNGRGMSGDELCYRVREQGITLPSSTRAEWFKTVGGYRRDRQYRPDEITKVLYRCTVYLAKKKQKTNRG